MILVSIILRLQHLIDLFLDVLAHTQRHLEAKCLDVRGYVLSEVPHATDLHPKLLVLELLHWHLQSTIAGLVVVYLELDTSGTLLIEDLLNHRMSVQEVDEAGCALHYLRN